jgi:hypothetical protein
MRRLILSAFILIALCWPRVALATTPASCTVSGVVYAPDGTTIDNGTVTFAPAGQVPQIIGGQAIYPKYVSTTTDASGNLTPISLLQGAAMNVTICQAGGSACSALVYVSVPAESSVSFALLLANTQISYSTVTLNELAQPATGNYNMGGYGFLDLDELIGAAAGLTIQGNSTTGSDNLNQFNVNGVLNVQDYGAVCSDTTVSVTTVGSSPTVVASGSVGDFKVGQSVVIPLAGASSTITTPTINSVELDSTFLSNPGPYPPLYLMEGISFISDQCSTDTTSSAFSNPTCTITYGYQLQSVAFDGSISAPSAIVYVTDGPAMLSIDNPIVVQWTTDPNAVGYILKRCDGESCTPTATSIYHVFPNLPVGQTSGGNFVYADVGNSFGHAEYTLANTAQAGILNTTITAINGLNVALATAPSQSGTFTMYHDDEPAFQAAAVAACSSTGSTCGEVYAPLCSTGNPYNFGQAMSLYGFNGIRMQGTSGPGGAGTAINWLGPIGGVVFNMNYAALQIMDGISVPSGAYNDTPGVVYDYDKYTGPTGNLYGPGGNPGNFSPSGATFNTLSNAACGEAGVCVNFGGVNNVDTITIDHLYTLAPNGYGGWLGVYSNSQNTYNEVVQNSTISLRDFGIYAPRIASFQGKNLDFESNIVDTTILSSQGLASIDFCVSESAQMFLWWENELGGMTISNCRIAVNPGPGGYFMGLNGGTFTNNQVVNYNWNTANVAISSGDSYGKIDTFTGNSFAQGLSGSTGYSYPLQPYQLPFTDEGGGQITPPYTAINNAVDELPARYARDGISYPIPLDFTGPLSAWESKSIGFNCPTNLTIPTNFTGPTSSATCGTSPSETDAFTVAVDGVTVGTITTQTSCSTTPSASNVVLSSATQTVCMTGQRLTVTAPATASGSDLFLSLQAVQ